MIWIDTNASAKLNFISKLWTIPWPQKWAGRVSDHGTLGSMYAFWNAGTVSPDGFKGKPGLMSHSAKVNSVIIFPSPLIYS